VDALADDPWRGWNPEDPAQRENPYPTLAQLRRSEPVNETAFGLWRLLRYADVVRLLRDVPSGVRLSDGTLYGQTEPLGPDHFMLRQDPPHHTRLRKLVSKAFTPRAIERMRPRVQAIADELVARALEAREPDLISGLALPVPATVICEMLGVPLADRDRFTQWTAEATHLLAAAFAPPDLIERGQAASRALAEYFAALIADRRTRIGDDLLSSLIRAEEAGDRLSADELLAQAMGLLIAGFETTIGLIGNGLLALMRHPAELRRLAADPQLIGTTVEECLRFDGPILLTSRILREDTRFGDRVISKDRMVWGVLAAANRDPEQFPDPDRFDVGRTPNEHLAFGGGTHLCLGAHLARMESQIAIGTLVRRAPSFEPLGEKLEWGRSLFRVLERLPVRITKIR
jgi:pimeloyl-[acyl-carrier protein] synthase